MPPSQEKDFGAPWQCRNTARGFLSVWWAREALPVPCGGLQRGSCDNHVLGARWRNSKKLPRQMCLSGSVLRLEDSSRRLRQISHHLGRCTCKAQPGARGSNGCCGGGQGGWVCVPPGSRRLQRLVWCGHHGGELWGGSARATHRAGPAETAALGSGLKARAQRFS